MNAENSVFAVHPRETQIEEAADELVAKGFATDHIAVLHTIRLASTYASFALQERISHPLIQSRPYLSRRIILKSSALVLLPLVIAPVNYALQDQQPRRGIRCARQRSKSEIPV